MKMSRLIEMILEFDNPSSFGRPDTTGIRGKGLDRKQDRRLKNFPYDTDISYGQPNNYDRGSASSDTLNHPLTPKNDREFSLRILGIEDPAQDEAVGTPMSLSRGGSSNIGSSVPGVGTGWANNPARDWDKGPLDDELDEDGFMMGPMTLDPAPPPIETPPSPEAPNFRATTDDDTENRLDRIWGQEDNLNFVDPKLFGSHDAHVIAPDPWSVFNNRMTSRGLYGLMPKESAWDRISGMTLKKREIS